MICWLSADDAYLDRSKTSRQLVAMSSGASVSYSTAFLAGVSRERSVHVQAHWVPRFPRVDHLFDRNPAWRLMALLFMNPINGSSVMLRRSALRLKGNFDSSLGNVDADGDLWMRYSALGAQFASISGPAVFYREHQKQTSKRVVEMTSGCVYTRIRLLKALHYSGRLDAVLRAGWPALGVAVRGGYRQWPPVGQCLCELSRDLACGWRARMLLKRLEAVLRRDGLWDTSAPKFAESCSASDELARFNMLLSQLNSDHTR
jgi:hypothetical protein